MPDQTHAVERHAALTAQQVPTRIGTEFPIYLRDGDELVRFDTPAEFSAFVRDSIGRSFLAADGTRLSMECVDVTLWREAGDLLRPPADAVE